MPLSIFDCVRKNKSPGSTPPPPLSLQPPDVACYVEETDNNEPLLTVRETLEFAGICILPVPTERLTKTPYWELLVEKLDLDEGTKAELMAGKNVASLKVRKGGGGAGCVCGLVWLDGLEVSSFVHATHTHTKQVRRAMAKERAKIVMSLLGLANCSETIIGDHTHRGVRCARMHVHHVRIWGLLSAEPTDRLKSSLLNPRSSTAAGSAGA